MTTDPIETTAITVSERFKSQVPPEPQSSQQVTELTVLSATPETRQRLVCRSLLLDTDLVSAEKDAAEILPKMLANTAVRSLFGKDALQAVNDFSDKMLKEQPPVDIPELEQVMKGINRSMRRVGEKYNPNDPKVLERYQAVRDGILARLGFVKTFFEEFMDDTRSLDGRFDQIVENLGDKQEGLLKNVAYYDVSYELNEEEIARLTYKIAVMEFIRDKAAEQANQIVVGDANRGDRGSEDKARITELVTFMENKIVVFQGRLWVSWAMAPQIRTMREVVLGMSERINETVDMTIPTMKRTISMWRSLTQAQQAMEFNKAVEEGHNDVMVMFANTARVAIPAIAEATAMPPLHPATVKAMADSLVAQFDGIIKAIEIGEEARAELEDMMVTSKKVVDEANERLNQARVEHVLAIAHKAPLKIARSVPAQS